MNTNLRKKICWYCEGNVPYDALQCSFCGSDLSRPIEKPLMPERLEEDESLDESLASLYKPPYMVRDRLQEMPPERPRIASPPKVPRTPKLPARETPAIEERKDGNKDALSLLFLSIGGFLMTLGLLLFFFSEEGSLILKWNANYWFLYCFLSLPLIYFGFRFLGSLDKK